MDKHDDKHPPDRDSGPKFNITGSATTDPTRAGYGGLLKHLSVIFDIKKT